MTEGRPWITVWEAGRLVHYEWAAEELPPRLDQRFRVLDEEWREENGQLVRTILRAEVLVPTWDIS